MIKLSDLGQVYIVCGKTDMRRGIDTLASMVKDKFNLDPFSGQVFLFCGGSQDRFKALYWDGQGYWLLYKRFENGKMNWPKNQDEVRELSPEQVDWLMKGFSIEPKISEATHVISIDFTCSFSYSYNYRKTRRLFYHVRNNIRKDHPRTSYNYS